MDPRAKILGIGTPIIDKIILVDNTLFLNGTPLVHASSTPVTSVELEALIRKSKNNPTVSPGGSTANTIKGLANLGHHCSMFGKIGTDQAGKTFTDSMEKQGVNCRLLFTDQPTSQVVSFVTPDQERTMASYISTGNEIANSEVSYELFNTVHIVHIEGYLLVQDEIVEKMVNYAKQAGALVSFDLASFEIVKLYKKKIQTLLPSIDIIFGNEEETYQLTGLSPEEGCLKLRDTTRIAVVKLGEHGGWVGQKTEVYHYPAVPVEAIDTTGAGDLFASGFIHGLLSGKSLPECANIGAYVAAQVVKVLGTDIPSDAWEKIKLEIDG